MIRRASFSDLLRQNPIVVPALSLILGIGSGELTYASLTDSAIWLFAIAFLSVVLMVVSHNRSWKPSTFLCFQLLTCFFLGMALLVHTRDGLRPTWSADSLTLRTTLCAPVKAGPRTCQATLQICEGENAGQRIRATLVRHDTAALLPGDVLLVNGRVDVPRNSGNPCEFDYAAYLRRQGISGVLFCDSTHWRTTADRQLTLPLRALRYRATLQTQYERYFEGYDLAVLSALTLGEKGKLTPAVREVFSETGTSHILALSGLHLGILFGFYNLLLLAFARRRRWRIALSIPGLLLIWGYALLAGMPTSLLRSAIMFTIMQLALWRQTDVFSLNNLALAACLILLFSPQALFDVGFQLSFLSVLGIQLFFPLIPKLHRAESLHKAPLRALAVFCLDLLAVSLCAQVFTLPLVAYYFNIVPLYGLLASYVAIPLAYPLLFFSVLFFIIPPLQPFFATVLKVCLHLLYDGLACIASFPQAALAWYPSAVTVILCYVALGLLYTYLVGRQSRTLHLFTLTIALCAGIELYGCATHRLPSEMVVYNLRGTTAVHAIMSPSQSYLWTLQPERTDTALAYVRRTFWQREGVQPPQPITIPGTYGPVAFSSHIMQTKGLRVGLLYDRITQQPARPLAVDYLLLARGYRQHLSDALTIFSPGVLVLDASLSDYYRQRFQTEAEALHINVHDIRKDGALVIPLK